MTTDQTTRSAEIVAAWRASKQATADQISTRRALVLELVNDMKLTYAQAAELLGISRARIWQIVEAGK